MCLHSRYTQHAHSLNIIEHPGGGVVVTRDITLHAVVSASRYFTNAKLMHSLARWVLLTFCQTNVIKFL